MSYNSQSQKNENSNTPSSIQGFKNPNNKPVGFANLESYNLTSALEEHSSISWYPPMVEIFRQNFPSKEVFFVEEGLLKLTHNEKNGKQIIVGLSMQKTLLGVSSALSQTSHMITAETLTNCCLRRISTKALLDVMLTDPKTNQLVQNTLCAEVMQRTEQIVNLGSSCAKERFEKLISEIIKSKNSSVGNNGVKLNLPLKLKEIADLIAVTPEHFSRILNSLQKEGVIEIKKGWITVKNVSTLSGYRSP